MFSAYTAPRYFREQQDLKRKMNLITGETNVAIETRLNRSWSQSQIQWRSIFHKTKWQQEFVRSLFWIFKLGNKIAVRLCNWLEDRLIGFSAWGAYSVAIARDDRLTWFFYNGIVSRRVPTKLILNWFRKMTRTGSSFSSHPSSSFFFFSFLFFCFLSVPYRHGRSFREARCRWPRISIITRRRCKFTFQRCCSLASSCVN